MKKEPLEVFGNIMDFKRRKFLIYGAEAGAMFGLVGAVPLVSGEHEYLRPPGSVKDDHIL